MALALALYSGRGLAVISTLPLAASSLVVGTGLFLIVLPIARPTDLALVVTALVNATMALPFAVRSIQPAVVTAQTHYGPLAAHLGMSPWTQLRWVILPRIRAPLGFAMGLAAALSMGDLGVIALFADGTSETLPLAMYRLMGAYRMDAAAGAGLVLVTLSFLLFWLCDQGGRLGADV